MAGKVAAKNAVITVNSQNLSSAVTSYSIDYGKSPVDVSGFSDGSQNFIPGQLVTGFTLDLLWDVTTTTGAWTVIRAMIATPGTGFTCSIVPEVGSLTMSGNFMVDGVTVGGDPSGALTLGSVHFSVQGATAPTWA